MTRRAGYVTGSLAMDDLIAASGASYRALTNPSFIDNTVRQVPSIKNQGVSSRRSQAIEICRPSPPATSLPPPHVSSSTRARDGFGEVPLLGPEDLSFDDMAEAISEVLGTRSASNRPPSRPTRSDSSASGCQTPWPKE